MHTLYSFELPASPSHGQFPLAKFRCKLSPSCQVMFSTSHSRYSLPRWIAKAFAVKWRIGRICSQELGFVLKSEQREALELLLRGKDVICVLPTGFDKSLFYQMWFMQRVLQVPFNGRPSLLSCLAKRGGSVGNTLLSPHAKTLLAPMNCFLCRVDCALEENVLTEQMWILTAYFFFLSSHTPYGCVRLACFARVRLLRHALPISLLILRKKPTVLQSTE